MDIAEKVSERIAMTVKATIVVDRLPGGENRVTSNSWDGEKVILKDLVPEVRNVDGQLHIARKPRRYEWDPFVPAYDPCSPGTVFDEPYMTEASKALRAEGAQSDRVPRDENWSTQQWTRGCFTGFLTPGATTLFRSAVRAPVGPLHWAGTETSTVWPSFIEGAIRSGERAVEEVKARS